MFVPVNNRKVYQHVIEQIQTMVMDGSLKKGDRLPSERSLAEKLGVSRTSVREALRALEVIGLIESRQGEGTFINGNLENNYFEPLSLLFKLNESDPNNIFQLRSILEIEVAGIAAEKIDEIGEERLKNILNRLDECEDESLNVKLDQEFHYEIAKLTENFLIISLLHGISSLMESFIGDVRKNLLKEDKKQILQNQHHIIYEAIVSKNKKDAILAMKEHMDTVAKGVN